MGRLPACQRHYFCLVLFVFCCQVLGFEQQKEDSAGHQWYEKGWKRTTASDEDARAAGSSRMRSKADSFGSGVGAISDLDEVASGFGEDDEDADMEIGSGAGSSIDLGVGSGDIGLPFSSMFPLETTLSHPTPASTITSSRAADRGGETTQLYAVHVVPDHPSPVTKMVSRKTTVSPKSSTFGTTVRRAPSVVPSAYTTQPTTGSPSRKGKPPTLDDRNKTLPSSFWMRPGVLAGLIGGAVAGLLAAILLVMFVVYRMRKKDEGSYALEEPKSPPNYAYAYQKAPTREFYA